MSSNKVKDNFYSDHDSILKATSPGDKPPLLGNFNDRVSNHLRN